MNPSFIVIAIVLIYMAAMLGVGWYASKKVKGNDDFLVAGRRLGPFMMAGTLAATEAGGGSSMGVAEKAFGEWGMSAGWYVLAMAITLVLLAVVAPRLRRSEVRTVPEFFTKRYGEKTGLLSAFLFIIPLVGLTATQFIASSVILSVMTGFNFTLSAIIVCAVVTVYSVLGGLWSVTLTDIIQWCLIVGGLLLAIPFALDVAGGYSAVMSSLPEAKASFTEGTGLGTIVTLVIMYFASFAVGQESVQRYFAARDEKAAAWGSILAALSYVFFAFMPALLGVIAYSMVQRGLMDGALIESEGARYVLPLLAVQAFPKWLVGIVFAALISATMSSADSDLLAAGSIVANDIYAKKINPKATEQSILKLTRWTMVVVALMALMVTLFHAESIVALLMFSFSFRAAGAFVPYVLGHYVSRPGPGAAVSSITGCSFVVLLCEVMDFSIWGMQAIVLGILASAVCYGMAGWFFPWLLLKVTKESSEVVGDHG
ncbi:MAG: sodium:solute symporter family protein [Myxococcales bacterium]|nr:MAG: sodium:solute symporter family protein [Myxococcales bacterium]